MADLPLPECNCPNSSNEVKASTSTLSYPSHEEKASTSNIDQSKTFRKA
jgi:hypothetical protein